MTYKAKPILRATPPAPTEDVCGSCQTPGHFAGDGTHDCGRPAPTEDAIVVGTHGRGNPDHCSQHGDITGSMKDHKETMHPGVTFYDAKVPGYGTAWSTAAPTEDATLPLTGMLVRDCHCKDVHDHWKPVT